MSHLRRLFRALLRHTGFGPKSAAKRGGPGFRGILDANFADIPDIVRFEMPIFRDHEALYGIDFPEPMNEAKVAEKYEHVIRSRDGGTAIYVADGRAVGYVGWRFLGAGETRQAIVLSISVEPTLRRSGIGSALFDYMRERVTAEGAVALRAHVWAHNTGSRSLFEARGFLPDHTAYSMTLKDTEKD